MTWIFRISTLLVLLAVSSSPALGQSQSGWASWYDGGYHGEVTASGEAYDHEALTAAHPTYPLGSSVRVIRTDTGKAVTVRINDRMTAEPNHVIDVSGGAARRLGLMESGIALVRVEPIEPPQAAAPATRTPVETASPAGITLQLGVFSTRASASEVASRHVDTWIQSVETPEGLRYRVYYKEFDSEADARAEQARMRESGQDAFLRWL